MMHVALSMVIFLSCMGAGMVQGRRFGIRHDILQRMLDSLRVLESKMTYSMEALPLLLHQCKKSGELPETPFFARVVELMENGSRSLSKCWEQSLLDTYSYGQLTKEDLSVLRQLGMELGTTDLQGQHVAFARAYQRMATQLSQAAEEKKQKEKLYQGVGIYIGLLIPLVLL